MRKTLLILAIATGFMLAPGFLPQPAEAGVYWSIGSGFSVGGFDFTVVFGRPYGAFADGHYYRTHRDFRYPGYRCHNGCSVRDGYNYHHRDCSLVRHHFRRHGFRPSASLWLTPRAYAPQRYYNGYDLYRSDRYRSDRYRYDRHRNDHRYDRHRYDRHRYDSRRNDGRYDRHRSERGRHDGYRNDRDRSRRNDWDSDSDRRRHDDGYNRRNDHRRRSADDTRRRRGGGE